MARIDPSLLARLKERLGIADAAIYKRIQQMANALMLERPEAALALAADLNMNISRWATADQRRQIAGARAGVAPSRVIAQPAEVPVSNVPRRGEKASRALKARKSPKQRGKNVFVVQGRNFRIAKAMFQYLRALHLHPIEWEKARGLTGKPNPYIGDVLAKAFDTASAVVVLMTPDDEARLKSEFRSDDDEEFESKLRGQPRPNVLFEAGFAISRYENQTVLVSVGKLRPFSDIQGRHVLKMDGSPQRRKELAMRLKSTGLDVDMSGNDWLSDGDFTPG